MWKGIHRIRDFTRKGCGIRDLTAPGRWDSPKLGTGCRITIKKESGMQDFHENGVGMQDQDPLPAPVSRNTKFFLRYQKYLILTHQSVLPKKTCVNVI